MGKPLGKLPAGVPDLLDLLPFVDVSEPNPLLKNKATTLTDLLGGALGWLYDIRDYGALAGAALGTQHAEINTAIVAANAAGPGAIVLVPPGIWMVDPDKNAGKSVQLLSNVTLWLSAGATLRSIATGLDLYGVVVAVGQSNVAVIGEGIIDGNRAAHIGATGEHGMCLWFAGCAGVKVRDIQCNNGWGDGIYLGENGTTKNTRLDIDGVTCDGNRRNGCSVVAVHGGVIRHSWFVNTSGTSPQAGIDLEPDVAGYVDGVIVDDCVSLDNAGSGYTLTNSSKNCRIHHCYSARNAQAGISVAASGGGNVIDLNTVADLTTATRGAIDIASGTVGLRLLSNTVRNITTGKAGYYVHGATSGIEVTGNHAKSVTGGTADAYTIDSPDAIVHDNTAEDCTGIGLDVTGARSQIVNNTAIRCVGRGFYLAGADCLVALNTALDISTVAGGMFQFVGVGAQAIGNRAILTTPDTAVVPFLFTGAATLKIGNLGIGTQAYTEPLVGVLSTAAQPNVTSLGTLTSLAIAGSLVADSATLGTNPAGAGTIRIPNNANVSARNGANTGDLRLVSGSSGDNGVFGSADLTNALLVAGASGLWALFGATGEFGPNTDNAVDFGAAAANRPRTAYIGTSVVTKRLFVSGATAHVAGDYALSAGWGTTASVSTVAARDMGGRVTITALGTGQASGPTVTLTFKDGTFTTVPVCVQSRGDVAAPGAQWKLTTISATQAVWTLDGLPVAGNVYILDFIVMGK